MRREEALGYLRRLEPNLVPIAAPAPGICCESCRSGVDDPYARCFPCNSHDVPDILPISMSVHGSALHRRLRRYKDALTGDERREHSLVLAVLLSFFLDHHRNCLGDTPDFVVTVPSEDRDALAAVVRMLPQLMAKRVQAIRAAGTNSAPQFELAAPQIEGRRVLLLDDTFTSGRSIAAAYSTLVEGGASVLRPLVIGRHFHPDYRTSEDLWNCLQSQQWSLDSCGVCEPVDCQPGLSPQTMF